MSDEGDKAKPMMGEVLRPEHEKIGLRVELPSGGIPLFNRIAARERRKEIEEYIALAKAGNAFVREINEARALSETFERGLVRTEKIDTLRRTEALKIDGELDAALDAEIERHEAAKDNALARRARRAVLEAQAIEAEQRVEALKNPPPAPGPKPRQSQAEWIATQVGELRAREKELIAALVGEAGAEEDLDEDDRDLVERARMATRDQIAKLFEELGR